MTRTAQLDVLYAQHQVAYSQGAFTTMLDIGQAIDALEDELEAVSSPCNAGVCEVAWHPTKPVGAAADYRANGFHLLSA